MLSGPSMCLARSLKCDDTDRMSIRVKNRHAAELAFAHAGERCFDRVVRGTADDFRRHHLGDSHVGRVLPFDDNAEEDVAVGEDSGDAIGAPDQDGADIKLRHPGRRFLHRRRGIDEVDAARHDVSYFHRSFP